jgi:hypothetical protein
VKWNREKIVPEQGIKSADQGSVFPDQGRRSGSGQSARTGNGTSLRAGSGDLAAIRFAVGDGELTQDLLYHPPIVKKIKR